MGPRMVDLDAWGRLEAVVGRRPAAVVLEAVEVLGLLEVLLPKVDAVLSAPSLVELLVVLVLGEFLGLLEVLLSSWWW